jgi:hypothetical protein
VEEQVRSAEKTQAPWRCMYFHRIREKTRARTFNKSVSFLSAPENKATRQTPPELAGCNFAMQI